MKPRDADVAVAAAEANTLRRRRRPATDGHSCSEFLFGLMLLITRLSTGFLPWTPRQTHPLRLTCP